MPRLKLRGWQFSLMANALQENANMKLKEIYSILTNYHGTDFPCNLEAIRAQAPSFLNHHKKQKDLYETKLHLFKLEHADNLSEEDSRLISEYTEKRDSSANLISKVEDGIDKIEQLNKLSTVIFNKTCDKDLIKIYDDELIHNSDIDDEPDPLRPPLTG